MEGFIGEVRMFGGNFAPRAWAFCDGQLLAISSNTALFSIIGCSYGGDCRTSFALPDMRGRSCLQQGRGPGLSDWRLAEKGGRENVSLTLLNLPNHNHFMAKQDITVTSKQKVLNDEGTTEEPDGSFPALIDGKNVYANQEDGIGQVATVHVGNTLAATNTGGGQSFDIHSPYTAVNFIICLQGVFPSRN